VSLSSDRDRWLASTKSQWERCCHDGVGRSISYVVGLVDVSIKGLGVDRPIARLGVAAADQLLLISATFQRYRNCFGVPGKDGQPTLRQYGNERTKSRIRSQQNISKNALAVEPSRTSLPGLRTLIVSS